VNPVASDICRGQGYSAGKGIGNNWIHYSKSKEGHHCTVMEEKECVTMKPVEFLLCVQDTCLVPREYLSNSNHSCILVCRSIQARYYQWPLDRYI